MRDLVDEVTDRLGLGRMVGDTQRYLGRNANVSGTTASGRRVFVKRVREESHDRFARALEFERRAGESPARPTLLGHDATHGILVYEFVPDATGMGAIARQGDMTGALARAIGEQVGYLHGVDATSVATAAHHLPSLRYFGELPLEVFLGMTAGELELVRLLQSDIELADAVRAIKAAEDAGAYDLAYIHADLRLDQLLWADGRVLLGDFEDARAGDPARDLGSMIGDLLYLALLTIPRRAAEASGPNAGHDAIMAAGADAVDEVVPMIHAFVEGYEHTRGPLAVPVVTRSLRFAGWHMFDRLFATAESTFRLDGAAKAAAGIGRGLIVAPERFSELVGALPDEVAA